LTSVFDPGWALVFEAGTFVVAALLIAGVGRGARPARPPASPLADLRDGGRLPPLPALLLPGLQRAGTVPGEARARRRRSLGSPLGYLLVGPLAAALGAESVLVLAGAGLARSALLIAGVPAVGTLGPEPEPAG
jgi:hypothetical protein